jgi:hypothetical protein
MAVWSCGQRTCHTSGMSDLLAELGVGPELYPFAFDPGRDAVFFIRMAAADYRRASFLDERLLTPETRGQWVPFADVARAMAAPSASRPLHFIFHSGHVGSTLLSRMLDETGRVLSLREPLPLRTMAEAYDGGRSGLDERQELLLRLWGRGFGDTEAVVLKATSTAARLGSKLMALRGTSKAVTLNVTAESYLATILAAENSAVDLNAHGPERVHRLSRILNVMPPRPTNLGELAAMSWLVERLTQDDLLHAFAGRILPLDFDALLQETGPTLSKVLAHLEIITTPDEVAAIVSGPVLVHYSKAPEHAYSANLRADRLAEARRLYSAEIRAALTWLEQLGQQHPRVAAIL